MILIAAVVCVVVGLRDDAPAAATARDDRTATTALLSARRTPFLFANLVAQARLRQQLSDFVTKYHACVAVDDPAAPEVPIVRVNGDLPLAPASTMKLLTGTAALAALGPDHTFTTRALLGDDGTLYFVGGGDPVLTTPNYEKQLHASARTKTDVVTQLAPLADAIAATGVTSIPRIVADDTRHDDVRFLPDWKPSYTADVGALGALTVNDGYSGSTRAADPAENAAEQLRLLLAQRGVTVGGIAEGAAPSGAREIASVTSPPLADIVASMLTSSDNLTAETLTREVGLARGGKGTTPDGTQAVLAALTELGIPTAGLDLRDGSGLAPDNRVTCDALLGVLALSDCALRGDQPRPGRGRDVGHAHGPPRRRVAARCAAREDCVHRRRHRSGRCRRRCAEPSTPRANPPKPRRIPNASVRRSRLPSRLPLVLSRHRFPRPHTTAVSRGDTWAA